MKKRILSILLVLAMLLPLFYQISPIAGATTNSGSCGDNAFWSFNEETGELTISGSGPMQNYSSSYPIVTTPWKNNAVLSITIEQGITIIGSEAFSSSSQLKTVNIANTVTQIGRNAFSWCTSLVEISIPEGVTYIGDYAFSACTSLKEIRLPDTLRSVGNGTFSGCSSLSVFTFPANMAGGAFYYLFDGCTELTKFQVDERNPYFYADDHGVLFSKDGKKLCAAPKKDFVAYTIPDGVTEIEKNAFTDCSSLIYISIPESVTSIGANAFENCISLTNISLPPASIGSRAFHNCYSLQGVVIPDSVTWLNEGVFENCKGLTYAIIGNNVTTIFDDAFTGCYNLSKVYLPVSLKEIGFSFPASKIDVYYAGTKSQWEDIRIAYMELENAIIHFEADESDAIPEVTEEIDPPLIFNENKYIVDTWLGLRDNSNDSLEADNLKYILAMESLSTELVKELKDNTGFENAIGIWNSLEVGFTPVSATNNLLFNKEEIYESLLLDFVQKSLSSRQPVLNSLLVEATKDNDDEISAKDVSKGVGYVRALMKGFKTEKELLAMLSANTLDPENPNYSAFYKGIDGIDDGGTSSSLWRKVDFLKMVQYIAKYSSNINDFTQRLTAYLEVYDMSEEMIALLTEMKQHNSDPMLEKALTTVINSVQNIDYINIICIGELTEDFAFTTAELAFNSIASKIPVYGQLVAIYKAEKAAMDLLANTSAVIDAYHVMDATRTFVAVNKTALNSLKAKYLTSHSEFDAGVYVHAIETYYHVYEIDLKSSLNFIKEAKEKGLINMGVNTCLSWINKDYKSSYNQLLESMDSILNSLTSLFDTMSTSWIYNEKYLKTDFPDMYPIYVQKDISRDVYTPVILSAELNKAGETEIYWNDPGTYVDSSGRLHHLYGANYIDGTEIEERIGNTVNTIVVPFEESGDGATMYDASQFTTFPKTYSLKSYANTSAGKIYTSAVQETITLPCKSVELKKMKIGSNSLFLIWDTSSLSYDNIIYHIYRKEAGGTFQKIKTINRDSSISGLYTTVTDETAKEGVTYIYKVVSEIIFENGVSINSQSKNMIGIIHHKSPSIGDLIAEVISQKSGTTHGANLRAVPDFEVQLSWDAHPGAQGYDVYRRESYAPISTCLGQVTGTTYVDTTARDDTDYEYYVIPYAAEGEEKIYASSYSSGELAAQEPKSKDVVILYTNDIHAYINNDGLKYSNVAALKAELEAQGKAVLLVDAGDHVQGTAYGSMDKGETIIKLMNAAGYDAATLGNHEFDYGMARALELVGKANYPYLSSNFYHEAAGIRGENVLDSYKIFEMSGRKVAIVGITTPETFTKSTPAYFMDEKGNYIYGIAGDEDGAALYADVQAAIGAAKAEGADYVIALGHLGDDPASRPWTSEELIKNVTGLDAFIDGHSHSTVERKKVTDKEGNVVVLTQTGEYLNAIGKLTISEEDISVELITEYTNTDETVKAIEDTWVDEVDELLGEIIAKNKVDFRIKDDEGTRLIRKQETNLGDFCADALYYLFDVTEGLSVDVAIMNGGGIRTNMDIGDISYKTTKTVHTFGNVACLIEVTGQQILDALEWGARNVGNGENGGFLQVSGLTYEIHSYIPSTVQIDDWGVWAGRPTGEYRVKNVVIGGKLLDTAKTYKLAGYNYTLRDLGDGFAMFAGAINVKDYVMEDYMVLANYAKSFPKATITADNSVLGANYGNINGEGRITVVEEEPEVINPFEDVKEGVYYYTPVLWAVKENITTGTSATRFSPDLACTRGQIVTFLWRASGSPKPKTTENPFSDISEKDYYYNAVLWAVEQGITNGTGKGKFSPNGTCTRGQVATFLWRAQGKPAPTSSTNPFNDVNSGAYYYNAVLWAVEKGVTNGVGKGRFSPDDSCTRGQIVTFLYRALI